MLFFISKSNLLCILVKCKHTEVPKDVRNDTLYGRQSESTLLEYDVLAEGKCYIN